MELRNEIISNDLQTLQHYVKILNSKRNEDFETTLSTVCTLCQHLLQKKVNMDKNMWKSAVDGYMDVKKIIFEIMDSDESDEINEQCFEVIMKFICVEGKCDVEEEEVKPFPSNLLDKLLQTILRKDRDTSNIIMKYCDYLHFDDLKYFTLKYLLTTLKEEKKKEKQELEFFVNNVFKILSSIRFPILGKIRKKQKTKQKSDVTDCVLYCESGENRPKFHYDYEKAADLFSTVWILFLSFKIPTKLYRKILIILDDHIMPHFKNPLSLSDFLINSFDVGGAVSLLSLSSLFLLIQKCNLEYPDFYNKLYSLFEPNILYVKYRARFFFWSDVFLTSTHLPEYLVAAFIKRLSRMALTAPVDALFIIIPFIQNLFVRHPNLEILVNRSDKDSVTDDPFNNDEQNPMKSNALESSLWEMKTLQKHWHSKVKQLASFIEKPLPAQETDLSEILETSFDDIINDIFAVSQE